MRADDTVAMTNAGLRTAGDPLAGFLVFEKPSPARCFQLARRPRPAPPPKRPTVTLRDDANLSIGINEVAYAALGQPAAVVLLWHPERRAIGLQAADPEDENAYLVQLHRQRGRAYFLTPRAFRQTYGLDQMPTTRLIGELIEHVLVVEVPDV